MPQTIERKKEYAKERRQKIGHFLRKKESAWRAENHSHVLARHKERRKNKRAMCLVSAARIRARKKGIPFELTGDEIAKLQMAIDVGVCELSGVPFTLTGPRSATSPSLDRIFPALGYVPGNVRVVCHALNAGMGDWGENELRRIVEYWVRR